MLQQHQVGALFGLFVRTVGAARFVRAVVPVVALVAVASIPLPRAASSLEIGAVSASSVMAQAFDVAQRATARVQKGASATAARASELRVSDSRVFDSRISDSHISDRRTSADARRNGNGRTRLTSAWPASGSIDHRSTWQLRNTHRFGPEGEVVPVRIGDRWLHWRAEQRASRADSGPGPRQVGDRWLEAVPSEAYDAWYSTAVAAVSFANDAIKAVAATGAEARAPPDAPARIDPAGVPQPAVAGETTHSPQVAAHDEAARASGPTRSGDARIRTKRGEPETFSPLKLSDEQRNISRFVSRRYRVKLDEVQRFVAHAFRAASEFRLDPYLVLAVMSIESSFDPNARSPAGAQGLMQVLTRVHLDKFAPFGGARAALDPVANISVGSRILKEYLVREGSVEGALKSYVGAALLSHDFGYGSKVLSERERILAAAREAAAPSFAGGGTETKLAMLSRPVTAQPAKWALVPSPGAVQSDGVRPTDGARPTGLQSAAVRPSAQSDGVPSQVVPSQVVPSRDGQSADAASAGSRSADGQSAGVRSVDGQSADGQSADLPSVDVPSIDVPLADMPLVDGPSAEVRLGDARLGDVQSAGVKSIAGQGGVARAGAARSRAAPSSIAARSAVAGSAPALPAAPEIGVERANVVADPPVAAERNASAGAASNEIVPPESVSTGGVSNEVVSDRVVSTGATSTEMASTEMASTEMASNDAASNDGSARESAGSAQAGRRTPDVDEAPRPLRSRASEPRASSDPLLAPSVSSREL